MATPNYKNLVQTFQKLGAAKATEMLQESFRAKETRPQDYDLGRLWEEFFGIGAYRACKNGDQTAADVFEAAGSVSTAGFTNVSGQIIITGVRDAFVSEDFVFTPLIPTIQGTSIGNERIADISPIGDEAMVVPENAEYPYAGVVEDWVTAPEVQNRGMIVALSAQMVFQDKTNLLLERCSNVGYSLGLNLEKRVIDAIIDENGGASSLATSHRYKWRDLAYMATYNNNTGDHTFDNLSASTGLVDWTDLDAAEQLLNAMTDPNTGEPVVLNSASHLVCCKELEYTARRIIEATEINVVTPGYATSGNPTETKVGNPFKGRATILSSRLLAARMATDTTWYWGDLTKGLKRKVVMPLKVIQAPALSHDEFHRDIVKQWRANEMSSPFWIEPRAVVKCTVA